MVFDYTAKTSDGETQVGSVQAATRDVAIDVLRRHNLAIMKLEAHETAPFWSRIKLFGRVNLRDLSVFSRQFATLFEAKVPMIDALRTLEKQTENTYLKAKILDITADVEAGMSLSASLARYPDIFSSFFVSMMRSGEITGNLDNVAAYMADYLEKQYALYNKIRSALWYPVLIVSFFVAVSFAMVYLINKNLRPFILEFGTAIPWPTKVLLGTSQFIISWFWLLAIILGIVSVLAANYLRTREGKYFLDNLKIRLPIFGRLYQYLYITNFAETFGTLIAGGISISQALLISGDVIGNEVYRDVISKAHEAVTRGEMTSRVIAQYPKLFPPVVAQMLVVGEKTGRLEDLLKRVASFYRRELDRMSENLVVLIEPVLIIGLGVLVLLLIMAVLLPIYQLVTSLSMGA